MVEANPAWKARVVYGDTDSMFVLLPGRSRADAFRIGSEIAAAVTACNPDPVTLKMEKVYHPCMLLSKKRYVGFAYETPDQVRPDHVVHVHEALRTWTSVSLQNHIEDLPEHGCVPSVGVWRKGTALCAGTAWTVGRQDGTVVKRVQWITT